MLFRSEAGETGEEQANADGAHRLPTGWTEAEVVVQLDDPDEPGQVERSQYLAGAAVGVNMQGAAVRQPGVELIWFSRIGESGNRVSNSYGSRELGSAVMGGMLRLAILAPGQRCRIFRAVSVSTDWGRPRPVGVHRGRMACSMYGRKTIRLPDSDMRQNRIPTTRPTQRWTLRMAV